MAYLELFINNRGVNLKDLGEYLKECRVNHGVSVEEACSDLNMEEMHLENIELGNIRAFKDVYILKDYIIAYAKYLGLDSNKILDEFNDFLFEHTSKISLADIEEAKNKQKEEKKIISPYTKEVKQHKNILPVILICAGVSILLFVIILIFQSIESDVPINKELKEVVLYDFA